MTQSERAGGRYFNRKAISATRSLEWWLVLQPEPLDRVPSGLQVNLSGVELILAQAGFRELNRVLVLGVDGPVY